jgi:phosphatidylserine decarboxylase
MTISKTERTRIENKLPVAREGLPFFFVGAAITILFFYAGLLFPAILMGIISLFTLYFFRDPERGIDADENAVLTPADGTIIDIRHLKDSNNPLGEPAIKLSIFMSVFNVHVNRVPINGRISEIVYNQGKFFSANLDKASEQNESNRITLETDNGRKIVFVQIAGLIARRIVCWIKEPDYVKQGQRCGLIRFGSRLDVYIPGDSRVIVESREKVKAGETVLGYIS